MSSAPTVAVPDAVRRPSNGWIITRPSSATNRSAVANASCAFVAITISAPKLRVSSMRRWLAVPIITTFADTPANFAAHAVAIAWLPALTAVTPRRRCSWVSDSRFTIAPRALKLPVRCSNSSLAEMRVPAASSGATS